MGAEAGMPLHFHTNSLTLSTVTFPNSYDITARYLMHRELALFKQSSQFIFSSTLSNNG